MFSSHREHERIQNLDQELFEAVVGGNESEVRMLLGAGAHPDGFLEQPVRQDCGARGIAARWRRKCWYAQRKYLNMLSLMRRMLGRA